MKISFKSVAAMGIPFATIMIVFRSMMVGTVTPVIVVTGLVGGLLFGVTFTFFVKYFQTKVYKGIMIPLNPSEKVLIEGGANHFKGAEAVGGKLVLTDQRLIFKSHPMNIQNHEAVFDLQRIKNLSVTKTFKILNNGLQFEHTNNEFHRFLVDEPSEWVKEINALGSSQT